MSMSATYYRIDSEMLAELQAEGEDAAWLDAAAGRGFELGDQWEDLQQFLTTDDPDLAGLEAAEFDGVFAEALVGSESVAELEDGGVVRIVTAERVREIAEAFRHDAPIPLQLGMQIETAIEVTGTQPLLPGSEGGVAFEELTALFHKFGAFYVEAAESGDAIIVTME